MVIINPGVMKIFKFIYKFYLKVQPLIFNKIPTNLFNKFLYRYYQSQKVYLIDKKLFFLQTYKVLRNTDFDSIKYILCTNKIIRPLPIRGVKIGVQKKLVKKKTKFVKILFSYYYKKCYITLNKQI